jgi:hypothetical protein
MSDDEFEAEKKDLLVILREHAPHGVLPSDLHKLLTDRGHKRSVAKSTTARLWDAGVIRVDGGLLITLAY